MTRVKPQDADQVSEFHIDDEHAESMLTELALYDLQFVAGADGGSSMFG